jgi:hypothetical protein
MEVRQGRWKAESGWTWSAEGNEGAPSVVFVFGGHAALSRPEPLAELAQKFPNAQVVGCSSDGEVEGSRVFEEAIVATAIRFDHTEVHVAEARIIPGRSNHEAGVQLAQLIARPDLAHMFVISSAVELQIGALTKCITSALPRHVALTGGVAPAVCYQGRPMTNAVVAVGFFGHRLRIGYGALDGKDPFGAESRNGFGGRSPELAILTSSSNSRRAPTMQMEEEVRSVRRMLGPKVALTGFCAQANVSPFLASAQQSTVTTLREE